MVPQLGLLQVKTTSILGLGQGRYSYSSSSADIIKTSCVQTKSAALSEENQDFWLLKGEDELEEALSLEPNTNLAKNIILFIGDGMSLPTVTAARVYKGQQAGNSEGSSAQLSWEKLPHVGLSKVNQLAGLLMISLYYFSNSDL